MNILTQFPDLVMPLYQQKHCLDTDSTVHDMQQLMQFQWQNPRNYLVVAVS